MPLSGSNQAYEKARAYAGGKNVSTSNPAGNIGTSSSSPVASIGNVDPFAVYNRQVADQNAQNAQAAGRADQLAGWAGDSQKQGFNNTKDYLNISDQQNKNLAAQQRVQANRAGDTDWFQNLRKLAAAGNALGSAMGNGANGSGMYSVRDVLELQDDIGDVDVYQALRQNQEAISNALYEQLSTSVNSRNQAAANVQAQIDAIMGDNAAQRSNLSTASQDLWAGLPNHSNFYGENKMGALPTWDDGYMRSNQNFASLAPRDSHGNNSRTGAVANSYAQRMDQGYARR